MSKLTFSFSRLPEMTGTEWGCGLGDYSVAMVIGRSGGMGRKGAHVWSGKSFHNALIREMFVVGANPKNKQNFWKISYLSSNIQPLRKQKKNPSADNHWLFMQIAERKKRESPVWAERCGGWKENDIGRKADQFYATATLHETRSWGICITSRWTMLVHVYVCFPDTVYM